jgi:AraC-like DNA-binding protein
MPVQDDFACIPEDCRDQHLPMVPDYAAAFRSSGIRGVGLHEVVKPYEIRRRGAPWHLVLLTLDGQAHWEGSGGTGELAAGEVWIGAAETPHRFYATGPWKFVSAALFPIDAFAWMEGRVFCQPTISNLNHLWAAAEAYLYESAGDTQDTEDLATHLAGYISAHIQRELKQEQGDSDSRTRLKLRRLWESVNAGPGDPWSVAVLAQQASMSVRHFQRTMQEQYGITAETMLKRIRMEHARELLLSTGLSLDQICERAGYQSVHAFAKAFKRYAGVTPGSCRKQLLRSIDQGD